MSRRLDWPTGVVPHSTGIRADYPDRRTFISVSARRQITEQGGHRWVGTCVVNPFPRAFPGELEKGYALKAMLDDAAADPQNRFFLPLVEKSFADTTSIWLDP